MITNEQKVWLNHLTNTDKIRVVPYNPETKQIFERMKRNLIKILGKVRISHRGSTNFKISGQGEIDLYIPVAKRDFDRYLHKLINNLGKPGTLYPLKRARFVEYIKKIKIEIFLINRNDIDWKNLIKFEKYLRDNSKMLKAYERLKIKANGLSVRKYYYLKTNFINKIILVSKKSG